MSVFSLSHFNTLLRNITICPLVQFASGENVVTEVHEVIFL